MTTTHTTHTTVHIPDAVIEQWSASTNADPADLHPYLAECLESGTIEVEPSHDADVVDFHLQTALAYISFTASRVAGTEWKMRLYAAGEYNGPRHAPHSRASHLDVPSTLYHDVFVQIA